MSKLNSRLLLKSKVKKKLLKVVGSSKKDYFNDKGVALSVLDGIANVYGLNNVLARKMVDFRCICIRSHNLTFFLIRLVSDLFGYFMLSHKIIKGTQWEVITKAMKKNSFQLFGIKNSSPPDNVGAEYVSHFYEMSKFHSSDGLSDKYYMPLPEKLIYMTRPGYPGKLHDGLHFDGKLELISCKIEYKSSMERFFNDLDLCKFQWDYSKLGVDRIDLCHINNSSAYERTTKAIESFNPIIIDSFNPKIVEFNPVDWKFLFNEPANKEFIEFVNYTIIKQVELNPVLSDAFDLLLTDPSFFPVLN